MVMQWTVNPPPMARLVRSQDTPPLMPRSSNGRAASLHGADGSSILSRGTKFEDTNSN